MKPAEDSFTIWRELRTRLRAAQIPLWLRRLLVRRAGDLQTAAYREGQADTRRELEEYILRGRPMERQPDELPIAECLATDLRDALAVKLKRLPIDISTN